MTHTAQAHFECDFCGAREVVAPPSGTIAEDAPLPAGWQNLDGPEALIAPLKVNITVKRRIRIHGTGHPIDAAPDKLVYIATFQLHGGALVFHAFEETP